MCWALARLCPVCFYAKTGGIVSAFPYWNKYTDKPICPSPAMHSHNGTMALFFITFSQLPHTCPLFSHSLLFTHELQWPKQQGASGTLQPLSPTCSDTQLLFLTHYAGNISQESNWEKSQPFAVVLLLLYFPLVYIHLPLKIVLFYNV